MRLHPLGVGLGLSFSLSLAGCGSVTHTHASLEFASPETPDLTARGADAVRLRVQDASVSLTRSGVMVDPRGYLLTTFSSVGVGAARARGGRPGTLFAGGDEVRVEVFEGPFSSTPTEYVGRVVRGDLRLNLALVRITGTPDGPLDPEARFAFVAPPTDATLTWGGFGWAIGASPTIPSLTAFHANTTAGVQNSEGHIAGYLVNVVEPTLDGAGYYDARGELVGVYMNGFVRPTSRIPTAWRTELAAGAIDDRRIEGIITLEPGRWAEASPIGDSVFVPGDDEARADVTEEFLFALPSTQAGTIEVEPPVAVVAYQRGRALQSGNGEIYVPAEPDVYVAVRMPRPTDPRGLRLRVRFVAEQ
ncbi:MAG: serine protease [Sandaracinaceae bacterium]|nr:serine protease [Sandaracinaceae bacterium]